MLKKKNKKRLQNKMKYSIYHIIIITFLTSCEQRLVKNEEKGKEDEHIVKMGNTVSTRFMLPGGFERIKYPENSFELFLQNFTLKPANEKVHLYNGELKKNQEVHAAILDIDVGNQDLQQCADAVMRLRAEYLYKTKKYNDLHFNFVDGFKAEYSKWIQGNTIAFNNGKAYWSPSHKANNTYESFRQFMNIVFGYASTLSLAKELTTQNIKDIKPGDVFIRGGSPGHAVIVMDVAQNKNGKKCFMIAQSYMPAQEMHILKNFTDEQISPWYMEDFGDILYTPEYTFKKEELKKWPLQTSP